MRQVFVYDILTNFQEVGFATTPKLRGGNGDYY
jgi:hypothetical protein